MSTSQSETMLWQEALHYYEIGHIETAQQKLEKLLSHNPQHAEGLYFLGCCYADLEQYDEAKELCLSALQHGYNPEEVYYTLGHIYTNTNELEKAEQSFLNVLYSDPSDAQAMAKYAFILLKTGHIEKAKQLIQEAVEVNPNHPTVRHYQFILLLAIGTKQEIEESLKDNYYVSDNEVNFLVKLGLHAASRKRYREAYKYYRQAFLLAPNNKDLLEILEEAEELIHPIFFPNVLIDKIGGPLIFWAIGFGTMFLLATLHSDVILRAGLLFYIIICIWSWLSTPMYKLYKKIKRS
ncbi:MULTISPECIES: lipopolysaccharide assembly protein LapB [unclassified Bacillus (in: firmicutes)]|uniref:tetratricopeptide repeat protein n=1 Tax=unclassified Bacillus (in: firmicutes) TaxID=185979 RepID=UPI0008F22354|nr:MULTISPECIES: tetratricopeptide repeat protein [unclassified Bacillus (in: firmicutes)]SFJ40327.1 Tfp pilus assembly protein PilF [Bacillus sp. 71mf]SFT15087.1 Tfp pilus assembly protein PilF [Bacillus sp. 103mf]